MPKNKLSSGQCDSCSVPKMRSLGDGKGEPYTAILWCKIEDIEIIPLPLDEQIVECEFYKEI